jgi:hypothetical protein
MLRITRRYICTYHNIVQRRCHLLVADASAVEERDPRPSDLNLDSERSHALPFALVLTDHHAVDG